MQLKDKKLRDMSEIFRLLCTKSSVLWVFAVNVSVSSGIPSPVKTDSCQDKSRLSLGTVSIVSQVPSYKTVMGREGGRRCCQLNPSNPSYLWLCFVDLFVYSPPPLPRNSLLVNCEILRKNLIPILPGLLWELIRKFSSGAGIYSQIAGPNVEGWINRRKN